MGGDAEDVDGAGADLHDEQGVQPLLADGIYVKEVRGEEAACLGLEELGSLSPRGLSAVPGRESGGSQDTAVGGCADDVAEAAC
ncbi:hypothetical protein GCM10009753_79060 [Streptantibioticus ferralitis]